MENIKNPEDNSSIEELRELARSKMLETMRASDELIEGMDVLDKDKRDAYEKLKSETEELLRRIDQMESSNS